MARAPTGLPSQPLVCILSGVPLGAGGRYALASRMITLALDLNRAGYEILLVAPDGYWTSKNGILGKFETARDGSQPDPTPVSPRSVGAIDAIGVFLRVVRLLKREGGHRPVVIVSTGVWLPLAGRAIAALRERTYIHLDVPGIPQLEVALSRPRFWKSKVWLYDLAFALAAGRADIVTTINNAHAQFLSSEYGLHPLILPDLLREEWLKELASIPERTAEGQVRILYAGALFGSRIQGFLRVLSRLVLEEDVVATVIGEGPDRTRYQREHQTDKIQFAGYVTRELLAANLANADICYSDVWHEIGTPYKVLEYMAAGRAVVSHDTISLRETITNGVNGILCSTDDESLLRALRELTRDGEMRKHLGEKARSRILEIHSGDRLRGLPELYRRCCDT